MVGWVPEPCRAMCANLRRRDTDAQSEELKSYSIVMRESQRTFRSGAEASLRHRGSSGARGPGHMAAHRFGVLEGLAIEPGRQGSGTQDHHSGEARKSHDKDAQSLTSLHDPSPSPCLGTLMSVRLELTSHLNEAYPSAHLLAARPAFLCSSFSFEKNKSRSTRDLQSPSNFPWPLFVSHLIQTKPGVYYCR